MRELSRRKEQSPEGSTEILLSGATIPPVTRVIRIRGCVLARLVEEARRAPSQECCGFLAGRERLITSLLAGTNILASATAYEIAPVELFRMFRAMRADGLEHLGIYHSHPTGDNFPSPRDIERAYYPEVAYFIVSPHEDVAQAVRAFSIREGRVVELRIEAAE